MIGLFCEQARPNTFFLVQSRVLLRLLPVLPLLLLQCSKFCNYQYFCCCCSDIAAVGSVCPDYTGTLLFVQLSIMQRICGQRWHGYPLRLTKGLKVRSFLRLEKTQGTQREKLSPLLVGST